jgi:hypothetical protein
MALSLNLLFLNILTYCCCHDVLKRENRVLKFLEVLNFFNLHVHSNHSTNFQLSEYIQFFNQIDLSGILQPMIWSITQNIFKFSSDTKLDWKLKIRDFGQFSLNWLNNVWTYTKSQVLKQQLLFCCSNTYFDKLIFTKSF